MAQSSPVPAPVGHFETQKFLVKKIAKSVGDPEKIVTVA